MDNHILNEVKRNRELMGIVEQNQGKLIRKGKFDDVDYEMYEVVTKFFMGPFSIDNEKDIRNVFLERLDEIGIPERECSPLKVENKTVSCEIKTDKVKKLLDLGESELDEQGVIGAVASGTESGKEFTDDEYRLLGMIDDFLRGQPAIDKDKSLDDNADWIANVRSPMGRFGRTLFDYLNNGGEKYDENKFTAYLNTLDKLIDKSKTPDDNLIKHGKSITRFEYNN